jgi:ribonuclease HI
VTAAPESPGARSRPHDRLLANIDGGARGNPGPAGFGARLVHAADGEEVAALYGFLGHTTNNVAEYAALLALLEHALPLQPQQLEIRSDSQLLVRQMRGEYKVKDANLKVLHAEARALASRLGRVAYVHVPREENREADALANQAMDEQASNTPLPRALSRLVKTVAQLPLRNSTSK